MNKNVVVAIITAIYIFGNIYGLVRFFQCDFDGSKTSYKAEIVYGIGIVTGLNGILGYIDFGK